LLAMAASWLAYFIGCVHIHFCGNGRPFGVHVPCRSWLASEGGLPADDCFQVYIPIPAVTATYGFALMRVAWKSL
jgi:hypothetical protein